MLFLLVACRQQMGETCRLECNRIGGNFMFHTIDLNPRLTTSKKITQQPQVQCFVCLIRRFGQPFFRQEALSCAGPLHSARVLHNAKHEWTYIMHHQSQRDGGREKNLRTAALLSPNGHRCRMMVNRPTCSLSYLNL